MVFAMVAAVTGLAMRIATMIRRAVTVTSITCGVSRVRLGFGRRSLCGRRFRGFRRVVGPD